MDDVIAALDQRNVKMTKRRLTDWIHKGLLPPLAEQRDARGRIRRYAWTYPRIVEQAAVVNELLALVRRVDRIYSVLWLLDFAVAPEKALIALRLPVAQTWGLWGRGVTSLDELEDNISRHAFRATWRKRARQSQNQEHHEAAEVFEVFFNLVANPRSCRQSALQGDAGNI